MNNDGFVVKWARVALHFLVFSALAGVLLRFYNIDPIDGLNYKFLMHTHSHIALLGWLYLAFTVVLVREFLPGEFKWFNRIFITTLFTVIGMMLSFPFQGYGVVSITFSTLFLFTSYWFVYEFLRRLRDTKKKSVAINFVQWALFFLVISSLGPWALGPIILFGGSYGKLYSLSIYYYLHFLYNGFFILALLSIVLKQLDNNAITYNGKRAKKFFQLTVYAVIPAYALSALWIKPPVWVFVLGAIAGVMQLFGLLYGWSILKVYQRTLKLKFYQLIFWVVLVAYSLKLLMQVMSALPEVASYIYETRMFTAIGYIHLVMLGILSLFSLTYFIVNNIYRDHLLSKAGLTIFLCGLVLSEIILFVNGIVLINFGYAIPNYSGWMFSTSLLMPVGLFIFWFVQLREKADSI